MSKEVIKIRELTNKGIDGYNELIYRLLVQKDYKKALKYSIKKMDIIINSYSDLKDEDVALSAYVYALNEDYESARNCFNVLFEDGDEMKDESRFDLYASVASALCYLKEGNKSKASKLIKQALTFKPNSGHFGMDELVLRLDAARFVRTEQVLE